MKPFILTCGAPGTGKSTEAYKSFQDSLTILSSINNAHYYKVLMKRGRLNPEKYKFPKKFKLIDTNAVGTTEAPYADPDTIKPKSARSESGQLVPVDQKAELEATLNTVVARSLSAVEKGEKPPYANVIIDECGTFWQRVFEEILPTCTTKNEKIDARQAYVALGGWSRHISDLLRQLLPCGVGVCLVLHDREPESGKKGGPKLPSATIGTQLCADADGVIQRVMKDPEIGEKDESGKPAKAKYLWVASAGEQWHRKLRGLEPEDADIIGPMELEDILEMAGFSMSVER